LTLGMALLQPLRGSCHIQNVTQGWAADPKSEFAEGMRFLQLERFPLDVGQCP